MRHYKAAWERHRPLLMILGLILVLAGSAFAFILQGHAAPSYDPPGPDRFAVTTVDYTKYTWWLIEWDQSDVICKMDVNHDGLPTPGDVYINCGEKNYNIWINQQPCTLADTHLCKGFYAVMIGSEPAQKDVSAKLAPPIVQVTLENCDPVYTSSTSICETDPVLVLTGTEPLPGYTITSIGGTYQNQPFSCGAVCRLRLPLTDEKGFTIQFWAYSSYGDSSEIFTAKIRTAQTNAGSPDQTFWYVDVLSDQWAGVPVASCVENWGVFPPIGGPPQWLSTPTQSEELGTTVPYTYLAANLISKGAVDASACANNGLLPNGGASACGIDAARTAVVAWQNQFDDLILNVAKSSGVPANLLKNLFAKESQFWPGASLISDVGLGQLTEQGADTTLMWNPPFFSQFCPLVTDSGNCKNGYLGMDDSLKEYVRLSLISSVNANCDNCPLGIDLQRADFSISVFAQTLLANCGQAGQLVKNFTGGAAGNSASYDDLWKLTLANYNAGPGCLGDALDGTTSAGEDLTWENISTHFSPACQGAVNYVNDISQ
jgi:hypothetical protein